MTWVKVYNSMPWHPKILTVGPKGGWLFVCGLCYSNAHLTDGFVPRNALVMNAVAPGLRRPENIAATLVDAGLWHEVERGWRINDYAEHQRKADEIRERRERDRQRKALVRKDSASCPRGQTADSAGTPERVHGDRSRSRSRTEVEKQHTSDAGGADTNPYDDHLCAVLLGLAAQRNPKFKVRSRSRWMTDMRLLREVDDNTPEDIERAIKWVFQHDFWGGVIQSPGNLRQHFPRIWGQMTNGSNVRPLRRDTSKSDPETRAANARRHEEKRLRDLERLGIVPDGGAA